MPLGMLGKYERLDVLGHGASGIVYLAKDTLLGKQVALKEIAAQGDERVRFLEEARVLDRLRHPNIVHVNAVDEIGGKVVIDMEYIRGRNLQDILRDTPQLPLADAVSIAAQICDGLAFAHANRTVHRDIKPANILVTHEGVVKLVDFGLAEVLGTHSMAGGAGTYAYMAPEDFHEEEQSDRQSDIWAVGVILYEMLAGRRPFQVAKAKDPFAWKRAVETDPIPPVTETRPDAPPALDAILARALARDKNDRYWEADEMARALRAVAVPASEAPPVPAPPLSGVGGLPGFPPLITVDDFLTAAPDQWPAACDALAGGALARWLADIGETPLAEVARQLSADTNRSDDDRLRDFLYRAGLETAEEARRAFDLGCSRAAAGRIEESIPLLRRAANFDPTQAIYHQELAKALRAAGDSAGAALALEHGLKHHPALRALVKERAAVVGAVVALSQSRVDFGVLRRGQTRAARIVVRNAGTGVLQGRVVSTPGWVRVEPAAFTTRQRQALMLTADTENVWQTPGSYSESVVLETSGGRQEIGVSVSVLPARRGFWQVFYWYLPLLFCCLLPLLVGVATPYLSQRPTRNLWQPGLVTSGLLSGALFVVTVAADTSFMVRLIPMALLLLEGWGIAAMTRSLDDSGSRMAQLALAQTVPPVLVMLFLLAIAVYSSPRGWGRWQIWGAIVAVTGLLASYGLLHMG